MGLCPKCGERVFKMETRCFNCGVSFKWLEEHSIAPPPDSLRPSSRTYVFCSRCGAEEGSGGITCTDGNPHGFTLFNRKPICNSCGKVAGYRTECVIFHQFRHDFTQ